MLVELGNAHPKNVSHSDPAVCYVNVAHTNTDDYSIDHGALKSHLVDVVLNSGDAYPVHNFPGSETLTELFHPGIGIWFDQSNDLLPSWVYCEENPSLAAHIAAYTGCPVGRPADVEQTHHTNAGGPGVTMSPGPTALVVNTGLDILSRTLGGFIVGFNKATATGATSTSLTATSTPFVASAYIGSRVVSLTSGVWANVQSNTTSVLTVDRWYNPATPGGAAATTPGATDTYCILDGGAPCWFMGISTTNSASVATDTTMAGEITTASGGCLRTLATYAHSASATTYTLANTFTTNGSDTGSLPYAVARDGIFNSMVVAGAINMLAETLLNAIATLSLTGDAVTVTHTFTV